MAFHAIDWSGTAAPSLNNPGQFCPEAYEVLGGSPNSLELDQVRVVLNESASLSDPMICKLRMVIFSLVVLVNTLVFRILYVLSERFTADQIKKIGDENERLGTALEQMRIKNAELDARNQLLQEKCTTLQVKGENLTERYQALKENYKSQTWRMFTSGSEANDGSKADFSNGENSDEEFDESFGDTMDTLKELLEDDSDQEFLFTSSEDGNDGGGNSKKGKGKGTPKEKKPASKKGKTETEGAGNDKPNPGKKRNCRSKAATGVDGEKGKTTEEGQKEEKKPRTYKTREEGDQAAAVQDITNHEYVLILPDGKELRQDHPFTIEEIQKLGLRGPLGDVIEVKEIREQGFHVELKEILVCVHPCVMEYSQNESIIPGDTATEDAATEEGTLGSNDNPVKPDEDEQEDDVSGKDNQDAAIDPVANPIDEEEDPIADIDLADKGGNTLPHGSRKSSGKGKGKGGKGKHSSKSGSKKARKAAHKIRAQRRAEKRNTRKVHHTTASMPAYHGYNCHVTPSLLAWILSMHFVLACSIYRIIWLLWQKGYSVSQSTVYNWAAMGADDLRPVADHMFNIMKADNDYLCADETWCLVMRETGRENKTKSYFWLYATPAWVLHQICVVKYHPGRGGSFAAEDLKGCRENLKLTTDAYQGYNAVKEVVKGLVRCLCICHARRYFRIAACFGSTAGKRAAAQKVVDLFSQLYAIEKACKGMDFDEIKAQRQQYARPIFKKIQQLCQEILDSGISKGSQLYKAAFYFIDNIEGLQQYLYDGRLPIDNNRSERLIKPITLIRANSLLWGSPVGARRAADILTIIRTAEMNGLDPQRYLEFLFESLIGKTEEEIKDPRFLETLMPWNQHVQDLCKKVIRRARRQEAM